MSRIQVVKPNASAYSNFYGQSRRNETVPTEKVEVPSPQKNDGLAELAESRRLNETLRNELQQVIRFNVALQQEIEALQTPNKYQPIVSVVVPRDDDVDIGPFLLQQGRTYIIESHITCINIDMVDGCGIVLALYEKENTGIIGTGAAAWNGRVNAEDDNPYAGMNTVVVRGVFTPSETKEYAFVIRIMGRKYTQVLLNHPTFPCTTMIL
jgi:hypothetical protein